MTKKKYEIVDDTPHIVSESPIAYNNIVTPMPGQIRVNIEDMSKVNEIKRAICMISGVISVESSPATKSYLRARADVDAGRVVEFENLDALKRYYNEL